jgi:TolB-like protein/tetratricopeptide (TPR) repeat protein
MSVTVPPPAPPPAEAAPGQRLDSWKEIAAYLKRDESTVRRWEKEGLPVRRLAHKKKATVYAYKSEIDVWWNSGHSRLESASPPPAVPRGPVRWAIAAMTLLAAVALGVGTIATRDGWLRGPRAGAIGSLAVLPLKNLSGDARQDYFADGMTEALITELGKISALQVVSHQSVSGYRQSEKTVPEIARALKVDAVLEGTVLYAGDRVRITANLVQAVPERHLWAESYDFNRQDVLAIQSRVAREVAARIRLKLTSQEQARLTTSRRVDPEAYEAYLLGRAYFLKPLIATSRAQAKQYFERAIERDPGYAPAYASLAELSLRERGAPTKDPHELRRQARQWAAKALALDDTLAEAHNALARASQQEWDWVGAEREYQRAIELNPSYPLARSWYAMYLFAMLRHDEAVAQARRAQQLDPASPGINTQAGAAYFAGGRFEEAMASWRRALELEPRSSDASVLIAKAYVSQGRYQEAIAELQEALTVQKERPPLVLGALAHAFARSGQREEALKLVRELKRIEAERPEYVPPFGLIWAYAGLGDTDQAFAWLERAYEMGSDRMVWLNLDPFLVPLRAEPRFHDLVRRIGLPIEGSHRSG